MIFKLKLKTIPTHHIAEATCKLKMGCWCQNAKHSCLISVYLTAEHCTPVWFRSVYTRLIGSVLNEALRIVTECLRPAPTYHLPILSGIQPGELRRLRATLSLAYRGSLDPDHILYGLLRGYSDARQERIRSRRPFVPATRNLLNNLAGFGIRASEWTNYKWNAWYNKNTSRIRVFYTQNQCQACWDELSPNSLG